jgi:NAD(P)-dependent dehydrogenase (short-subunit alcohol dehydrogenase family)
LYLFDLTGKVAVVTGGTRGIGLMMARGLLQAGASVYVSSRKPEAGEAAVAELSAHGRIVSLPADLAREEECVRLAAEVGRAEERVHILVNNAGTTWGAALEDFPSHGWDKVVDLNLKTPFYLTQAFLPLLEAAGSSTSAASTACVYQISPFTPTRPARPACTSSLGCSPASSGRGISPSTRSRRGHSTPR